MADTRVEYDGHIRHVQSGTYLPLQVTLDELEAQHAKGWVDYHPESFCHRCGNQNVTWWTSRKTWDPVMRPGAAAWKWHEIICIPCFIELAERMYGECAWRLTRDDSGSEVLTLVADWAS